MKRFLISLVMIMGFLFVSPQIASAEDKSTNTMEIVVTYDTHLKITIITLYQNGKPTNTVIKDATGKVVYHT